jgi:hypothetical protein
MKNMSKYMLSLSCVVSSAATFISMVHVQRDNNTAVAPGMVAAACREQGREDHLLFGASTLQQWRRLAVPEGVWSLAAMCSQPSICILIIIIVAHTVPQSSLCPLAYAAVNIGRDGWLEVSQPVGPWFSQLCMHCGRQYWRQYQEQQDLHDMVRLCLQQCGGCVCEKYSAG